MTLNIRKVQTHYLCLIMAQQEAIGTHDGRMIQHHFDVSNQAAAHDFLMHHGLDQVSWTSLDSHWNAQWSSGWSIKDGEDYRRWTLYQWYIFNWHVIVNGIIYVLWSACGYDPNVRWEQDKKKKETRYQQRTATDVFHSISQLALLTLKSLSFKAMARSLIFPVTLSTMRAVKPRS